MKQKEVHDFFEGVCKTAIDIFNTRDQVSGFIFVIPSTDCTVPVFSIVEDKEAVSAAVQAACIKVKAQAGIVVSEAWSIEFKDGEKWDGTPPSERLDRKEILQVALFSREGSRLVVWDILRNPKRLGEMRESKEMVVETRFFGKYFQSN